MRKQYMNVWTRIRWRCSTLMRWINIIICSPSSSFFPWQRHFVTIEQLQLHPHVLYNHFSPPINKSRSFWANKKHMFSTLVVDKTHTVFDGGKRIHGAGCGLWPCFHKRRIPFLNPVVLHTIIQVQTNEKFERCAFLTSCQRENSRSTSEIGSFYETDKYKQKIRKTGHTIVNCSPYHIPHAYEYD